MSWLQLRLDCDRAAAEARGRTARRRRPVGHPRGSPATSPCWSPASARHHCGRRCGHGVVSPPMHDLQGIHDAIEPVPAASLRSWRFSKTATGPRMDAQLPPMRFGRAPVDLSELARATGSAGGQPAPRPGLAFGTGTHPTTALCLEALDSPAPRGAQRGRLRLRLGHPRYRRAHASAPRACWRSTTTRRP
jgi:ribosomal protein L11 methyltransferase